MDARPYQLDFRRAVHEAFTRVQRVFGVLPTGGGKTVVFSQIAHDYEQRGERTLILAHRDELVKQAVEKLHKTTGIMASVEKAEMRGSRHSPVIVGSVQTLKGSRLAKWPQNHFGLVIADECHHALSPGWQTTLRHFTGAKILGVTATPNRTDKKSLMTYFEHLAYEISLSELIDQKYLSPITVRSIPLKIEVGNVGIEKGDWDTKQLATALDPYLPEIARAIKARAPFRRILIFLPLIATSQKMNQAMLKEGFVSEHVSGESDDRGEILKRFASGYTEVLCNAMLLTEGYDCPAVDCVVNLRLTKSESLYSQIIGRGTRLYPGKENLLVLDFLWQHGKHNICRPASLLCEDEELAAAVSEATAGHGSDEELDLKDICNTVQEQRENALARELERKRKKQERADALMKSATEQAVSQWGNDGPNGPHSLAQRKLIIQFGIDPTGMTKAEASKIIGEKIQANRNRRIAA